MIDLPEAACIRENRSSKREKKQKILIASASVVIVIYKIKGLFKLLFGWVREHKVRFQLSILPNLNFDLDLDPLFHRNVPYISKYWIRYLDSLRILVTNVPGFNTWDSN